MAEQPVVVHEGPYSGLYVPLNGQFAYVQGETRPYAPPFNTVIYDSARDVVFYSSTPNTINNNESYSVAPQSAQDEYAYHYFGYMPYCNGVVHEVKNSLTTMYTIVTLAQVDNRRRPMTPQTVQRPQRSIAPTNTNPSPRHIHICTKKIWVEVDDDWLDRLNFDEFDGH
jgi:hypothetical protein